MKQRSPLPHITVATVIERDDRFLLVVEMSHGRRVYNQPAGHMEHGETLLNAAARETFEETCWRVTLTGCLGISQYRAPNNGITYVRHSFAAKALALDEDAQRDPDILDTVWLTYEEVLEKKRELRSPLVLNDIERYRRGQILDMDFIEGFVRSYK